MRVFDFDNTIYDGESVVDFFLFVLKKKKELIKFLPLMLYTALLYKLKLLSIDKLYDMASRMSSVVIKNQKLAKYYVDEFWDLNYLKLKDKFLNMIDEESVIISAAPRVLLDGIKDKLKTKNIICSEFNVETGKFEFICFGSNKVLAFKEKFPDAVIEEFYTDTVNDKPLMKISKNVYIVKGNREKSLRIQ